MKFSRTLLSAAAAAAATFAMASAQAATTCSVTDLVPQAEACSGFYDGNLLNAANIAEQQAGLAAIGFTWDGSTILDAISPLNGSHTVDFTTLLTGISFVGIHFGNGTGGPGQATAFYRIDAGAGLDTFMLNYNASSNAVLYSTTPAVPEPGTYALMFAGLGVVGFMARRRKQQA